MRNSDRLDFSDREAVEQMLADKTRHLLTFLQASADEPFRSRFATIKSLSLRYIPNADIAVKVITHAPVAMEIQVSFGLVRFLACLNAHVMSALNTIGSEGEGRRTFLKREILNALICLLDKDDLIPGKALGVPLLEADGFLAGMQIPFGQLEATAYTTAIEHQLELILLHEFFHVADDMYTGRDRELQADLFAIRMSRRRWGRDPATHTVFCEFFQLVLFIYLDLHEFLRNALDNAVLFSRTAADEAVPIPRSVASHPEVYMRFQTVTQGLAGVSVTARYFFECTEYLFKALKREMVAGRHDLSGFKALANVRLQMHLKSHVCNQALFNGDPELAAVLEARMKTSPQIDVWTWRNHLPNVNIWLNEPGQFSLEEGLKRLEAAERYLSPILADKFGDCEPSAIVADAAKLWFI